jgi:hypothetical protein
MELLQLHNKINQLPPEFQDELLNYAEFLLQKSKNEIKKTKIDNNKREFGCGKGMFVMSSDFDEPLNDFKEYMP